MEDDDSHDFRYKRQADAGETSARPHHHKRKRGPKTTTPKPGASGDSPTTGAPKKDGEAKTTTTKSPKGSGTSTKKSKKGSESTLNPTTHLLLKQQEKTALDHMLAGVYDWIKVLKLTKGATLNKMAAGELLTQMEKVKKILKDNEKPDKLMRLYKEFNEE